MDPEGTLSSPYPPCTIVMPHFSQHKRDSDEWYSQPFYSSPGGYKLCLCVDANGDGDGKGTDMSVYIYLMKGENDDQLKWPFGHNVKYGILNWKRDESHIIKTILFKTAAATSTDRVTSAELAATGEGHPQVISHTSLYGSKDESVQFLHEDSLCVQVLEVEPPK